MTEPNGQEETKATPTPEEDPLLLGLLTSDEFAEIAKLNHQRVLQERQIANLEIQKYKLMVQVGGVERALQQQMEQIGTRLNIPKGLQWHVVPDANGDGHARAIPPDFGMSE